MSIRWTGPSKPTARLPGSVLAALLAATLAAPRPVSNPQ